MLAVVALAALLGSACGNDDTPAEAPAPAVTEAPAVPVGLSVDGAVAEAVALASEHQVAGADYYAEVLAVFAHAVGAAASGDAAHAAAHYREAVWHAIAAANATSAAEARAAYPLPDGIDDPKCTRLAHYHPDTSCHFHSPRPACRADTPQLYYKHDPAGENGHAYTTLPDCPTPADAATVTKDASAAVLAWQHAASTAAAAADEWQARSQQPDHDH